MRFGLLGSDVAYYAAVYGIASFGYLILVNKKACVGALYVLYSLEKASYFISKFSCPFWFVGTFHQVPVLLGFPVSRRVTAFIRPGCIVTYPVVFLVCAQSSPDFWTKYV